MTRKWPATQLDLPVPHALLDAGSEPSIVLLAALDRRMREMHEGFILEVDSAAGCARVDIANWCEVTGNTLVGLLAMDGVVRFWIRKC